MANEPSHHAQLHNIRDLIAITEQLNEEYEELREASRLLRQESRQLSDDSYLLRRIGTSLLWGRNT